MTYETYLAIKQDIDSKPLEVFMNWEGYLEKIKKLNNFTDDDMLDLEGFMEVDSLNTTKGDLTEYDCPKCNNRGFLYTFERVGKKFYYPVIDCECKKVRKIHHQLKECGIHSNLLKQYTFENFKTNNTWRVLVKSRALEFVLNSKKEDFNNWFIVSGQSGAGKSHISTAIFIELIKQGKNCKYMLWKDEADKLMKLKKSYDVNAYDKEINKYKIVDVLYIDDFLKLLPTSTDREHLLDIAYSIINARASNGLITIISTEIDKEEFRTLDNAIHGRMTMMSDKYWIQIPKTLVNDYRENGE